MVATSAVASVPLPAWHGPVTVWCAAGTGCNGVHTAPRHHGKGAAADRTCNAVYGRPRCPSVGVTDSCAVAVPRWRYRAKPASRFRRRILGLPCHATLTGASLPERAVAARSRFHDRAPAVPWSRRGQPHPAPESCRYVNGTTCQPCYARDAAISRSDGSLVLREDLARLPASRDHARGGGRLLVGAKSLPPPSGPMIIPT
jgi:hypothetical protein